MNNENTKINKIYQKVELKNVLQIANNLFLSRKFEHCVEFCM